MNEETQVYGGYLVLCQSGCAIFLSRAPLSERFERMFQAMEPGWQQRLMFHDPRAGQLFEKIQRSLAAELGGKGLMEPALFKGWSHRVLCLRCLSQHREVHYAHPGARG